MNEGFGSKSAGHGYADAALWTLIAGVATLTPWTHNTGLNALHYLGNSGADRQFDVGDILNRCPQAMKDFSRYMQGAMDYALLNLEPRDKPYRLLSDIADSTTKGGPAGLYNAIGGFRVIGEAKVWVYPDDRIWMEYTYHFRDPYKWDGTGPKIIHEGGWGKEYMLKGSYRAYAAWPDPIGMGMSR